MGNAEAVRWYGLAAAQGHTKVKKAQFQLGFMLEVGQRVAQDYAEAMRFYRLVAEAMRL